MKKECGLDRKYILKKLKEIYPQLHSQYKVKKIGLFGSYAKNLQNLDSDIDIYVEFEEKNFRNVTGLWAFLEKTFNAKIDLFYPHKYSKKSVVKNIKQEVIYG
jgi:predicted nucleotidyltransferase